MIRLDCAIERLFCAEEPSTFIWVDEGREDRIAAHADRVERELAEIQALGFAEAVAAGESLAEDNIDYAIAAVCAVFEMTPEDLGARGRGQTRLCREAVSYVLNQRGLTLEEIGEVTSTTAVRRVHEAICKARTRLRHDLVAA